MDEIPAIFLYSISERIMNEAAQNSGPALDRK